MIVRELVTLLGFTVDKAEYDKAAKQYDSMQGKLIAQQKATQQASAAVAKQGQQAREAARGTNVLGQALGMMQRFGAQLGLSNLLRQYATLASDANETRSALGQLFGQKGADEVETWSQTMGTAMGRSSYDLQKYAAGLGAVLGPVTESQDEAQAMAQSLSELAVDLGSFFNTTDDQAMHALRSGLTGEMESLKKYGIVINDAALKEVALQKGIKKKITAMTQAEKTQLRYDAIMAASTAAQGDAARTSEGMANATKALQAQLKTLGIDAAKKVVPVIEKLVRFARDAVTWFSKMAKNTRILESAMYTLAAVAGILALEFYGAFILPAAAIAALIVLVDDLWTAIEGGDSVLGEILGPEFFANIRAGFEIIKEQFRGLDALGVWDTFVAGAQNAVWAVGQLIKKLISLSEYIPVIWAAKKVLRATGVIGPEEEEKSFAELLAERQAGQSAEIAAGVHNRAAARAEREREAKYGPSSYQVVPTSYTGPMSGEGFGVLRSTAPDPAAAGGAAGGPVVNAPTTITITTQDNPEKIKRAVTEAMDASRKKTMAAVGGRGRS